MEYQANWKADIENMQSVYKVTNTLCILHEVLLVVWVHVEC